MTSHNGHEGGSDVFHDANQRGDSGNDEEIEDDLRLAGVRSHNPFATADNQDTGSRSYLEEDLIEPRQTGPNDPTESLPASAVNPRPQNGMFQQTDPFDHDREAVEESGSGSDANLQTLNSNVNGDRKERGTDVYSHVEQGYPDDGPGSPGHSDSDSVNKSPDETEPTPRGIRFAGNDTIDKAPTHEDDENDNNNNEKLEHHDSHGFMDKLKSLSHDAKEKLHLSDVKIISPIKGFNPTNVHMRVKLGHDKEVGIIWRSRDNRKGRNSVVLPRASMAYPNLPPKNRPVYSSSFKGVGRNLYRMAFSFPYWDMAFWSGWSYTWGSVLFVIDGVWAWGPAGWDVKWTGLENYGVGILFFVGALLYQVGAVMAYLEAVNDGSFHGSAMKRFLEGRQDEQKRMLDEKIGHFFGHLNPLHEKKRHDAEHAELEQMSSIDPMAGWKTIHRRDRPGSIWPEGKAPAPRRGGVDLGEAEEGEAHEYQTWRWYPTWHALKTHHVYEIGYLACSVQLFGATLYSWCGLDSVPHFNDSWSNTDFYGAYYMPDIVGSCCFLTSSLMFLVETQERWWKPEPHVMGWWIGFWAMIGSWGFL